MSAAHTSSENWEYVEITPTFLAWLQIYRPPSDKNKNYKDVQNGRDINDRLLVDSRESNM